MKSAVLYTTAAVMMLLPATAAAQSQPSLVLPADDDSFAVYSAPIIVTGHPDGYVIDNSSSATKTDTPLINVPQSIAIITRDQLDDQAVNQLNDALRYVPGVVLGQGEGHRDQVTLRGQNTTADFFTDGLRDDAQYYRSLYNVERIEVLRGPNAMIFGRGGGGGVINRVSKQPHIGESGLGAALSADSFGAYSISADGRTDLSDNFAARLNGIYERFDNHRDGYKGDAAAINPVIAGTLGDNTRALISYEFARDRRAVDRGIPSLSGRPVQGQYRSVFGAKNANVTDNAVHNIRARLEHDLSDSVTIDASLQFADYDKIYSNVFPRAASATTVELEGYMDATDRQNITGQANLTWRGDTGGIGHVLLLGVEAANQESINTRRNAIFAGGTSGGTRITVPLQRGVAVPEPSFPVLDRSSASDLKILSAYIQDQISIGDHIQLIGGVRFDRFEIETLNRVNNFAGARTDEKLSPRAGLIIKPNERLSIYGSYSRSFLPQSGDQFLVLDATTQALAPERFENIEAGVKWAIRPDLAFTAAVYQLDRTNTRAPDPLNPALIVLTGTTRAKGIEAQLSGRVTDGWELSLGYALQDGEIRATTSAAPAGRRLAQLPRHQLTAWSRWQVADNFGIGGGVILQSRQFAAISNAVTLPAFTRVDAAVFWKPSDRLELQLNIENLLDERYFPSAHNDQNISTGEPLNARVTARFSF